MYKFIKQYTETMDNAAIYPMISLFIFLLFFVVLLIFVKKMKKDTITKLSNIPFDNEENTNSTTIIN
ncbi:MAG: CcoQ/FixQ family Cbb3-type cytochrome c oxidase assembly chaperone [Ferruginibacter sp.]|nr:CcoQ/FixQ family Cbb3-type cytochrome c oxidase assembly chaperone [Ferruginibacter sp.]